MVTGKLTKEEPVVQASNDAQQNAMAEDDIEAESLVALDWPALCAQVDDCAPRISA